MPNKKPIETKPTARGQSRPNSIFAREEEASYAGRQKRSELHCIELCAGAGGQALGTSQAGFSHEALVEIQKVSCQTLRLNRPAWNVINQDLREFNPTPYRGVDLLAGGVPCPPFSVAGKQLGHADERDLFPVALEIADTVRPKAIMLENVRGFLDPKFGPYRDMIETNLRKMGYKTGMKLLNASDFGVPQLRPRVVIVAVSREYADHFDWPILSRAKPPTVGEALIDLMAERGWKGATAWKAKADGIGPTIVGGSLKHGGPDLGPTRARRAWAELGVDGLGIANEPPGPEFDGMPRLTVRMVARLQGFPDAWKFVGGKTAAHRQVGNAFPPPVAKSVAIQIKKCFERKPAKTMVRMTQWGEYLT